MEVTGIYLNYMSIDSGIYKWPKLLKFIRIHNFIKYLRLPKLLRQQKDKGEILKTIFGRPPLRQSKVFYFTYKLQNCFFLSRCLYNNQFTCNTDGIQPRPGPGAGLLHGLHRGRKTDLQPGGIVLQQVLARQVNYIPERFLYLFWGYFKRSRTNICYGLNSMILISRVLCRCPAHLYCDPAGT